MKRMITTNILGTHFCIFSWWTRFCVCVGQAAAVRCASQDPDVLYRRLSLRVKGHDRTVLDSFETFASLAAGELGLNLETVWVDETLCVWLSLSVCVCVCVRERECVCVCVCVCVRERLRAEAVSASQRDATQTHRQTHASQVCSHLQEAPRAVRDEDTLQEHRGVTHTLKRTCTRTETDISLLIMSCIIEYVTNKRTLNTHLNARAHRDTQALARTQTHAHTLKHAHT